MKRMGVLLVMLGLAVSAARAQTAVTTTGGTPGHLARFTGSSTIRNSVILESNGQIGSGTPGPDRTLSVVNLSNSVAANYALQSSVGLLLYDSFDERFLNPTKWAPYGACFTFSALECVREIQDDRLRLAVRNYGQTNSNQGVQYGPTELHFTNPTPIRSIATELVVRRTSSLGCPANTTLLPNSHAHTLLQGNFFNSGSGNSADDVQALLTFDHGSSDPQGVLTVTAFMNWQGQFFGFVDLGTVSVGQKVVAQLSWDQPHTQFVAAWTDAVTGKVTQVFLPYTMPDTAPPVAPDKLIGVRAFTPNCVGTQMLVTDMETSFDRVWIGN